MSKSNNQKEIGRIKLSDTQELVISIVEDEKLDLRIWVKTDSYTGPTKRGVRLYLFDGIWEKFKELMLKVDAVYKDVG
ncbi:hypothetical protein ES702_04526 [subsurface metagenome]